MEILGYIAIGAVFIVLGFIAINARGSEFLIRTTHSEPVDVVAGLLMILLGLVISSLGVLPIFI